jgi:protoporphyrinogen oxidase
MQSNRTVTIIGGGPAGLAAAHECLNLGMTPTVFEMGKTTGGISRTESYKNYLFDIGGHRFFSRMDNINLLWSDMMGDDFLTVHRKSRIYYQQKFFDYPLKPVNALSNLGLVESMLIIFSYLKAQFNPISPEENFEQWVANRFGWRLYLTFFKTYTEKVWGIPCSSIQADWAAQRIKGLSLKSAAINALFGGSKTKSLIDNFKYPLKGPGMMWERFSEYIEAHGGSVRLNSKICRIFHTDNNITSLEIKTDHQDTDIIQADQVISSIPVSQLVRLFDPPAPPDVLAAADGLSYRSFLIVGLIVNREKLFPDQWIYIHSPSVNVGRIQNFKNWSAAMVPDSNKSSIGMEYFCDIGDSLWQMADEDLLHLAAGELEELGLARAQDVIDGTVIRQPLAYPVYDKFYSANLQIIRGFLDTVDNLQTIGRNGMHRYNNMDHSMQTGILAAKNITGSQYDLWKINEEEDYLEEDKKAVVDSPLIEKLLIRSFARMDTFAFASACGSLAGMLIFIATIWLLIKGGENIGQHLRLLGQYFIGYKVSFKGACIAFAYAFFSGFVFGWTFAYLRNLFLALYLYHVKKKNELLSLKDMIDYL